MKLSSKYLGSYTMLERIVKVAYHLDLPPQMRIHPIFHISLLKKKLGRKKVASTVLPCVGPNGQFLVQPLAILDKCIVKKGSHAVSELLIHWTNFVPENATWEDAATIDSQFPNLLP